MARSQSSAPPSESKTPLVVALVFFILATLVLGVLTYLGYGDAKIANEAAAKAGQEKATVQTALDKEKEKTALYRVAIGINSPEELTQVTGARFKDDLKAEHDKIMSTMADRFKPGLTKAMNDSSLRGDYNLALANVFEWKLAADGGVGAPSRSLLDSSIYSVAQQLLAQNNLDTAQKNYTEIQKLANAAITAANRATEEYKKGTEALPGQIAKATEDFEKARTAMADAFKQSSDESRKKVQSSEDARQQAEFDRNKALSTATNFKNQVDRANSELEAKTDPFQFDRPSGNITRRLLGSKQVEINLGSADNLKPGIKFSVQPSDTVERGLGSRLKQGIGPDGKPEYRIRAKANIEVVEILGPHQAVARITDEFDEIRERVMAGDLLYNSAWRKGAADHIALFGIFDLDADGVDDIQFVVNNLTKAGIVVDAYYDLATVKWVGAITERTIFAVEGYVPVLKGLDGNADYKARIISAMDAAKKQVQERGAKVVKIRDFFPRIGYDVNLGISDDRINQAASKYFSTPAARDPNEGK
jgi:hypothetical protein